MERECLAVYTPAVQIRNIRSFALVFISMAVLAGMAYAVVQHDTIGYERPVRSIRGRVTALGQPLELVWIEVYDNAQVCLDNSLSPAERRTRQRKIASVEPDADGRFKIKHLPKGFYEVEFGNRNSGGYNILSVLVNVAPKGTKDALCVDLSLEAAGGASTVAACGAK